MATAGAFAFGIVLGWFLYFTNRYRKGEAQLADVGTLIGVIGGGAVTALFGDAKSALFGAYGLGLAVGFFAYFIALIVMVRLSNGVFGVTWFLDGRRKKLRPDEEIGAEVRPTVAPMSVPRARAAAAAPPGLDTAPADAVMEERDVAIRIANDALRELARRIGSSTDQAERTALREAQDALTDQLDELVATRLRGILGAQAVQQAVTELRAITARMKDGAAEMKASADALAGAAKVLALVGQVIGIVARL